VSPISRPWEGDTLIVETTNYHLGIELRFPIQIEGSRTPAPSSGSAASTYEVTIEDPKVFTRPWKMRMPLYRRMEPHVRPLECICVEFVEELLYGHLMRR
jgi:hypothetical protein